MKPDNKETPSPIGETENLRKRIRELEEDLEEARRFSEERFREMTEMLPEMVFEIDSTGSLTYVNRRGLDMTGYTQQDLESKVSARDLFKKSASGDQAIMKKDGTELPVIVNTAPITRDGKPVGVRGIAFDITERKIMERRLMQSQKMEAMGRLAGGVAHDMNNVLAGISSLAALIKEAIDPFDPMMQDVEEILTLSARGGEFTRNLLGFARQGKFRKERVSLNKMVQQVEKILERTLPKNISMKVEIDPNLDYVEGDPGQITQALMNLCFNATDAMENGGTLRITTTNTEINEPDKSAKPTIPPGSYVKIEVADTGDGMDERTMNSAFEPFFTTKAAGRGTGLGLSMVYGVVSGHGGGVILKSEIAKGTNAAFLLPSYEPRATDETTRRTRISQPVKGSGTILLVDDEKILLDTGKRLLNKLGYDVLVAGDGASACRIYGERQGKIDLVLLDLGMPVMDGAECFYRLKEIDPKVRVLIVSGFYDKNETENLLTNGACGFLHKPFTIDHLSRAISRIIGSMPGNTPF